MYALVVGCLIMLSGVMYHVCSCCRVFDNAQWWEGVGAVDFVSNISRHFRMGDILAKRRYVHQLEVTILKCIVEMEPLSFTQHPVEIIYAHAAQIMREYKSTKWPHLDFYEIWCLEERM